MTRSLLIRLIAVALAAGSITLQPQPAWAQGNPLGKLTRGMVNLLSGWLEVPIQMVENRDERGEPIPWFPTRIFDGFSRWGARTAYGLWDAVTCALPPYDAPTMDPPTLIEPKRRHP